MPGKKVHNIKAQIDLSKVTIDDRGRVVVADSGLAKMLAEAKSKVADQPALLDMCNCPSNILCV